jgi:RHS repeat-associated protein
LPGFESGDVNDTFVAYITTGNGGGSGGSGGGNGSGLYADGGYRYGFNGKENDNDVKGVEGSQQDYGMRIYDPRIGKFLSVDPLTKQYPELTPYQFASNSPIQGIDLDGLELKITNYYHKMEVSSGKAKLTFISSETHDVHDGGWLGWKNLFMGSGHEHQHWAMRDGKRVGLNGWLPAKSVQHLQASADYTARIEAGDIGTIAEEERKQIGMAVAHAVVSKGLSEFGGMFKPNMTNTPSKIINRQVAASNGGKLGGRSIIVDENLSPRLVTELKNAGYKVKTFKHGTLDPDIITYAERNNSIVLTNNIKDFNKWGITTFKVSENMKRLSEVNNVVKAIENVNIKAQTNQSVIAPGKNVSLAENK